MRRKEGAPVPRWDRRPFFIFSGDPGGTTGCASAQWEPSGPDDTLTSVEQIKFRQWQIGPGPHHIELWATLHANEFTELVWESFEFRQNVFFDDDGNPIIGKTKVELVSCEYIGILELFCATYGTPHHTKNASTAKHLITDDKIKALGLWLPGMPHAMDATRHLLRYMVLVKKIQTPFVDIWLADD
jgi:hypothetical protein